MEVVVRNAEGTVSDKDREYAVKKLGQLDRYFNKAQKLELVHKEEKLGHQVEITVFADGMTIRGQEYDASMAAAIDRLHDKLETRLRKFKGRLIDRHRRNGHKVPSAFAEENHAEEASEPKVIVSEHKHFLLKPMSREEAALQMEMVDLAFYVFKNEDNGVFEVLYKRKNGTYGLMHPES